MEINWIKDGTETLSKYAELWDLTRTNTELNKQFEQTTKKPRGGGGGKKKTSDSVLIFLPNTSRSLYSLYVFQKKNLTIWYVVYLLFDRDRVFFG